MVMAAELRSCRLAPPGMKAMLNEADDNPAREALEFGPLEMRVRGGRRVVPIANGYEISKSYSSNLTALMAEEKKG